MKHPRRYRFSPLATSILLVLLVSVTQLAATAHGQTTADVCRETKKVRDQYERELNEVEMLLAIRNAEASARADLSELRRGIANGFVLSRLQDLAWMYNLPSPPASIQDKLTYQRTIRGVLEGLIQKAVARSLDDLTSQRDRIKTQYQLRLDRWEELNCADVLKRDNTGGDASKPDVPNLAGTWVCETKCPAGGAGKTASISQTGRTLTFTNEGGGTSSGEFKSPSSVVAKDWGDLSATIAEGGKKLNWANGTVWVKK